MRRKRPFCVRDLFAHRAHVECLDVKVRARYRLEQSTRIDALIAACAEQEPSRATVDSRDGHAAAATLVPSA